MPAAAGTSPVSELILVHGAWHDSRCWSGLLPLLEARGVRARTPDLPGHGGNALPLRRVSLQRYVDALVEELERPGAPRVLLGHSMAGIAITAAACRVAEKVRALVYLCAYLPRPGQSLFDLIAQNREGEAPTEIEEAMELSADKRSCDVRRDRIIPLFYAGAPAGLRPELAARFGPQATLPLSAAVQFDQDVFAGLDSHYICCSDDRVIPARHQRGMLRRQPCTQLLQIEADHSPFHSCPEQLAELLAAICR